MESFAEKMAAARRQIDKENYKEASRIYLDALNLSNNDRDRAIVWSELSSNFYRLQGWDSAIEAAENALTYDPEYKAREDLYRIIGFANQALGNFEKAQTYLEKSIQIDAHSEKQYLAIYELGKLYFRKQAYEQARKLFDLIEDPLAANQKEYWLSVLFFKGFIAYYQNDLDESRNLFEKLLNNTQDNKRKASGLFGMAFLTFADKDYLKTINLCETVMTLDPEFFDKETLGFLTAASFHNLGRTDIFDKYYDQMLQNFPDGRYEKELKRLKERGAPQR